MNLSGSKENLLFMLTFDFIPNLQPDLSGNPFLWLEKPRQKDWERKAEIAAINILKINQYRPKSRSN